MHLLMFFVLCRACACQMSLLNVPPEVYALIGQPVNITCNLTLNWHTLRIYIGNNEQVAFYSKNDNDCKNDAENGQNLTHICDLTLRRFGIGFKSIRSERNNSKVKFTLTYNEDTEHKEINKSSRIIIEPISVILKSYQATGEENKSMVFQCEAKAVEFAVISIKWFKDSVLFTNYVAVNRGTMISKIKMYPNLDDNGAILNCAVNISGKIFNSNNQTIIVGRGPVNVCIHPDFPMHIVASYNNNSEIFCYSNCTPACSYKWFSVSTASVIGQNSNFPHQNSRENQIEKYYCLAKNLRTGKEKNTTVKIYNNKYEEDIALTKSGLYTILENTSFILPCLQPDIKLLQTNEMENKNVGKKDVKRISKLEDTATMIFNATCFDAGLYTCKSTNCQGNETLLKFNISVLCHPHFLPGITFIKREVVIGKPIVITVRYIGYPPPILMLNRTEIQATDIRNKSFGFWIYENRQGIIHNAVIYKRYAESGDHGTYSLEISNCIGKTKGDILITVITTSFDFKTTIIISIVAVFAFFCISMVLIGRLVSRHHSYNDSQANSDSVYYVNEEVEIADNDFIPNYIFERENLYQNRIREIELRAIEPYENLSITEDNTSYEETIPKPGDGVQSAEISSGRRQYEEYFTDTDSTENPEGYIIMNAPQVRVENVLDNEDVEQ